MDYKYTIYSTRTQIRLTQWSTCIGQISNWSVIFEGNEEVKMEG